MARKRRASKPSTGKIDIALIQLWQRGPRSEKAISRKASSLENLIELLEPLSSRLYVITGHEFCYQDKPPVQVIRVRNEGKWQSLPAKLLRFLWAQILCCFHLFRLSRNIQVVIIFVGHALLLPALGAKLLGKKLVMAVGGHVKKVPGTPTFEYGGTVYYHVFNPILRINYSLADQIMAESESAIDFWDLGRYKDKLVIGGAPYVDINLFRIKRELEERQNLVGYVGRLSTEKGIMNLVQAIPLVLKSHDDIDFSIGGFGTLLSRINDELERNGLVHKVKLEGWIAHGDALCEHLNHLKLFVLPSYTEGVAAAVQEAMACGTPVLATKVGGIPDLIRDSVTGFLMEDNSPQCIAEGIPRALNHPKLTEIARNARKLMESEYAYEVMVEKLKNALSRL